MGQVPVSSRLQYHQFAINFKREPTLVTHSIDALEERLRNRIGHLNFSVMFIAWATNTLLTSLIVFACPIAAVFVGGTTRRLLPRFRPAFRWCYPDFQGTNDQRLEPIREMTCFVQGFSRPEELEAILDPDLKARCERKALRVGRLLVKNAESFAKISEVTAAAREEYSDNEG